MLISFLNLKFPFIALYNLKLQNNLYIKRQKKRMIRYYHIGYVSILFENLNLKLKNNIYFKERKMFTFL